MDHKNILLNESERFEKKNVFKNQDVLINFFFHFTFVLQSCTLLMRCL